MANLFSIVRATRRSYSAINRKARAYRQIQDALSNGDADGAVKAQRAYDRAERDYWREQRILNID